MNKETILSVMLAGAIMFGFIALLSKSIKPIPENKNSQSIKKKESRIEQRGTHSPAEQTPEIASRTRQPKASGINKCILAGKVIYSDAQCPSGSKSQSVKIEDSEGVISPDRETVNATMGRILAENKRNREQTGTPVISLEVKKKVSPFCENYKSQIEHLDALARQGNSSSVTERIRQERWHVQKLQLDGNCYK